jgi:ABC-type antimicrobial peptide transport system permease subunit
MILKMIIEAIFFGLLGFVCGYIFYKYGIYPMKKFKKGEELRNKIEGARK